MEVLSKLSIIIPLTASVLIIIVNAISIRKYKAEVRKPKEDDIKAMKLKIEEHSREIEQLKTKNSIDRKLLLTLLRVQKAGLTDNELIKEVDDVLMEAYSTTQLA